MLPSSSGQDVAPRSPVPSLAWSLPSMRPWSARSPPHFKFLDPTKRQAQRGFIGQLASRHMKKLSQHMGLNLPCDPPAM